MDGRRCADAAAATTTGAMGAAGVGAAGGGVGFVIGAAARAGAAATDALALPSVSIVKSGAPTATFSCSFA